MLSASPGWAPSSAQGWSHIPGCPAGGAVVTLRVRPAAGVRPVRAHLGSPGACRLSHWRSQAGRPEPMLMGWCGQCGPCDRQSSALWLWPLPLLVPSPAGQRPWSWVWGGGVSLPLSRPSLLHPGSCDRALVSFSLWWSPHGPSAEPCASCSLKGASVGFRRSVPLSLGPRLACLWVSVNKDAHTSLQGPCPVVGLTPAAPQSWGITAPSACHS